MTCEAQIGTFQSTPPARAATVRDRACLATASTFQSTPPARAATRDRIVCTRHRGCFNPRRPRGRRPMLNRPSGSRCFNPRRPRGRRPDTLGAATTVSLCFNPRRPRGRRRHRSRLLRYAELFQSTPPARAATCDAVVDRHAGACFNPRRPRGRRRGCMTTAASARCFNPRRPRGRRRSRARATHADVMFQSTPPARAATSVIARCSDARDMFQSTPPARAATCVATVAAARNQCFNPRRPRGRRRLDRAAESPAIRFNPRRPRGRRR